MKRLSKFLVLALIVGGGVAALASAKTVNGCELKSFETKCPGADLHGADLRDAILEFADFSHANLNGADLRGAHLYKALLNGAQLNTAKLSYAYLVRADLSSADLRNANLGGTRLSYADLSGADLRGARFCQTIMPDGNVNNSDCGLHRPGTSAPEPRLGEWTNNKQPPFTTTLQVQRVTTETRTDDGKRVTVTREDYFRLANLVLNPGPVFPPTCTGHFGDVPIVYGRFSALLERGWVSIDGEVLNPTTIRFSDRCALPPYDTEEFDLHPVAAARHRGRPTGTPGFTG